MTDVLFVSFTILALFSSIFGLQMLFYAGAYFVARHRKPPVFSNPTQWPAVTVQLPIYNESLVVERLLDSIAALDYPKKKLTIQVLDDSTDATKDLARSRIEHLRDDGFDIHHLWRSQPRGHKAGSLADAFEAIRGEFVAIFDADFLPPKNFLRRLMPYFADPKVGLVQARWGHLNAGVSTLTQAQAIALDSHQNVEQTVRGSFDLHVYFNGSAGIWRTQSIQDAGGWRADTLAEDSQLSASAQLAGWKMIYLPEVSADGELPAQVMAFKRQQFRWSKGTFQNFLILWKRLLGSRESLGRKLFAFLYFLRPLVHPALLMMALLTIPIILAYEGQSLPLGLIGLAGLGPLFFYSTGQWSIYPDWGRHAIRTPALMMLGIGLSLSNAVATFEAVSGRNPSDFRRTPKSGFKSGPESGDAARYSLSADWTLWGEAALALYTSLAALLASRLYPSLLPFCAVLAVGFVYTTWWGLHDEGRLPAEVRSAVEDE